MAPFQIVITIPIGNYDPPAFLINLDKSINVVFMLVFEQHGLEWSEDEYQTLSHLAHLQRQRKS